MRNAVFLVKVTATIQKVAWTNCWVIPFDDVGDAMTIKKRMDSALAKATLEAELRIVEYRGIPRPELTTEVLSCAIMP
jgi:hypothetical protein